MATWLWWSTSTGFALLAVLTIISLLVRMALKAPRCELRLTPGDGASPTWSCRASRQEEWRDLDLHCDYLGPWLIGLRSRSQRFWLWPDSADKLKLRELRRALGNTV